MWVVLFCVFVMVSVGKGNTGRLMATDERVFHFQTYCILVQKKSSFGPCPIYRLSRGVEGVKTVKTAEGLTEVGGKGKTAWFSFALFCFFCLIVFLFFAKKGIFALSCKRVRTSRMLITF